MIVNKDTYDATMKFKQDVIKKGYRKPNHLPFFDDENFPPIQDIVSLASKTKNGSSTQDGISTY